MKKVYSIPTVELIEVATATMLATSNSGDVDFGGGTGKPAASESRGEWGNVWGN